MKRFVAYGLTIALLAACSTQEIDFQTTTLDDEIFYASFEQPAEDGTRVYANEDLLLRWTADDRVSIFGKNTYNQQYKFLGETGDNSGGFNKVDDAEYVTGNPISHTVSVYPYQASTKISEDEVLTVTLPAEQHYAENTFGQGANTMVSVSEDNFLQYKNVGGFLRISLYGGGALVNSITLKGNNGEKLAGKATITMLVDGAPSLVMTNDATDEIRLVFETAIALGNIAEESKDFWFVVPPVEFKEGFSIVVSGPTCHLEKSTTKDLTIERNKLSKMSPIEVEASIDNNCIVYTSTDGSVINPKNLYAIGDSIISNEYKDGYGIITFDRDLISIWNSAFSRCYGLTSITIPDSVTSLGDWAFSDCTGLTSITIPDSVTNIGSSTFCRCTGLTSITIPDSVTSIGDHAFFGCTGLTSITIPNSVTSLGDWAFSDCTGLTSITIPDSVTSIGGGVFGGCSSIKSFEGKFASPDGHFLIDSSSIIAVAFAAFENGIISIPDNVTSIGDGAFSKYYGLTSITIPDSVTSIGDHAFSRCYGLTSITIPDSVTSLGDWAFSDCTGLTSITIPDSVTSIGDRAFSDCTGLTSITIPDSVTSIGSSAFSRCYGLTSITIPNSVTSIENSAFSGCIGLTSITIPDSVTSIGDYAFSNCFGLTSITIPNSVTSIGDSAFSNCIGLTSITIPDSVTSIGDRAFSDCTGLTSITIPDSVTSLGDWAFLLCTGLTSITIPNSVTNIGSGVFRSCTGLTSITIPDSVTSIGDYAFLECTGLTSITVLSETPPTGGYEMFNNTNSSPIYVPGGSVDAYKSALYWSDYADRIQAIPSSSVPIPEAVDLGLSVKWASFNLGASKPEEYGNYYAWGETEPKDDYSWSTYKWCEGTRTTLTKYCNDSSCGYNGFTDTKTVLDPEDDAAVANWGGKWRMPTDAEWTELRENCTWTETTQNGVSGLLVTGTKGKSVFLPAAGRRDGTGLLIVGSSGEYWSSSLRSDLPPDCAWYVLSPDNPRYVTDSNRCLGFSVRPVYAE